jgi:hypothetical protein
VLIESYYTALIYNKIGLRPWQFHTLIRNTVVERRHTRSLQGKDRLCFILSRDDGNGTSVRVVLAKQHDEEKCGTINVSLTTHLRHRTFDNGNTHSFSPRYQLRGTQGGTEHTEKMGRIMGRILEHVFLKKTFHLKKIKENIRHGDHVITCVCPICLFHQ